MSVTCTIRLGNPEKESRLNERIVRMLGQHSGDWRVDLYGPRGGTVVKLTVSTKGRVSVKELDRLRGQDLEDNVLAQIKQIIEQPDWS